jgi:hypothetical protein
MWRRTARQCDEFPRHPGDNGTGEIRGARLPCGLNDEAVDGIEGLREGASDAPLRRFDRAPLDLHTGYWRRIRPVIWRGGQWHQQRDDVGP